MEITKSALAEKLGVSRGRISQYLRMGLPVNENGSVDEAAAKAWVEQHVLPPTGGWGSGLRKCERKAPDAVDSRLHSTVSAGGPMAPPRKPGDWRATRDHKEWFFRSGAAALLNRLRCDSVRALAAELALEMGLTAAQAYGISEMWIFLLDEAGPSMISSDIETVTLEERIENPASWARFISKSGVEPNFEMWQKSAFEAFDRFLAREMRKPE
jgi:transcriptional regulator with XRE-family HTH domain